MSMVHRALLAFILSLFLLGMAAHAVPETALCACMDSSNLASGPTAADACLVCLLQDGISMPGMPPLAMPASHLRPSERSFGGPLWLVSRITHPPTQPAQ